MVVVKLTALHLLLLAQLAYQIESAFFRQAPFYHSAATALHGLRGAVNERPEERSGERKSLERTSANEYEIKAICIYM